MRNKNKSFILLIPLLVISILLVTVLVKNTTNLEAKESPETESLTYSQENAATSEYGTELYHSVYTETITSPGKPEDGEKPTSSTSVTVKKYAELPTG